MSRGVKVTYLFNLFDFWGAVVTSRPDVKALKDLEGKDLAAAKGTTNYVMFDWFARQLGADTAQVLGGQYRDARPYRLCAGRPRRRSSAMGAGLHHAAVEEARDPDASISRSPRAGRSSPAAATFPISASPRMSTWVEKNHDSIPKLYAAYKEAAEWVAANPEAAPQS